MEINLTSLYICVKDMARAIKFYTDFFERAPIVSDDIYSVFDINGFRFGLFAYQKMAEPHTFGSNCLPSLEVPTVTILQEKINNLEICFPLTKIGENWVAEFVDSEGNHIEITSPLT
ncbi:VOC family protein [Enterococcus sp. LJL120]